MIIAKLERSDSRYLELSIPENAKELTLSQKLDFDFCQMEAISYLKKYEDSLFKNRAGYILIIAKGLSNIFQIDFADIMELKGINLLEMNQSDFIEHLESLSKGVKKVNIKQLEKSLLELWTWLSYVINSVDSTVKNGSIEYKGITYYLPNVTTHPISGQTLHESLSNKQAIEIIQANNNYDTWVKNNPKLLASVDHCSWLFYKILSEISLLLNDEIPIPEDEFNVFMANQIKKFEDIDYQTAFSLELWFSGYMKELQSDKENKWFFESTWTASSPEEREAQAKAIKNSKKIFEATGIKSIISALLELNPFQKNGLSAIESIWKAKFSDTVKIISTNNARQ
ncbi:MAG: hypothetical protein IPO16_14945 [Saprospiraceae bacterium]|nr:hypothetical protein [Saprospiraceae bacterium]